MVRIAAGAVVVGLALAVGACASEGHFNRACNETCVSGATASSGASTASSSSPLALATTLAARLDVMQVDHVDASLLAQAYGTEGDPILCSPDLLTEYTKPFVDNARNDRNNIPLDIAVAGTYCPEHLDDVVQMYKTGVGGDVPYDAYEAAARG